VGKNSMLTGKLEEIVRRIVKVADPDRIILFGSFAYGNPHEESDIDLLVVMNSELPRYKRSVPIYKALADLLIPIDIIVYTPQEIEEWSDVPQAFITSILKKGKVIYEKNQSGPRQRMAREGAARP